MEGQQQLQLCTVVHVSGLVRISACGLWTHSRCGMQSHAPCIRTYVCAHYSELLLCVDVEIAYIPKLVPQSTGLSLARHAGLLHPDKACPPDHQVCPS